MLTLKLFTNTYFLFQKMGSVDSETMLKTGSRRITKVNIMPVESGEAWPKRTQTQDLGGSLG